MSPTLRRTAVVVVLALGVAVLLAWATVSGPSRLVEQDPSGVVQVKPLDRPQQEEPSKEDRKPLHDRASKDPSWSSDTLTVLGLLVSLLFLGVVARGLIGRISARLPAKRLVVDVETLPDVDPEAGREAVHRNASRQREALEDGDVRNGIVRCWVLLEEDARDAGVVHLPSETTTEFVVRFLHALDVDPRPVAELSRLYHEARFSTHPLGEDARRRAQQSLAAIHAEIRTQVAEVRT